MADHTLKKIRCWRRLTISGGCFPKTTGSKPSPVTRVSVSRPPTALVNSRRGRPKSNPKPARQSSPYLTPSPERIASTKRGMDSSTSSAPAAGRRKSLLTILDRRLTNTTEVRNPGSGRATTANHAPPNKKVAGINERNLHARPRFSARQTRLQCSCPARALRVRRLGRDSLALYNQPTGDVTRFFRPTMSAQETIALSSMPPPTRMPVFIPKSSFVSP